MRKLLMVGAVPVMVLTLISSHAQADGEPNFQQNDAGSSVSVKPAIEAYTPISPALLASLAGQIPEAPSSGGLVVDLAKGAYDAFRHSIHDPNNEMNPFELRGLTGGGQHQIQNIDPNTSTGPDDSLLKGIDLSPSGGGGVTNFEDTNGNGTIDPNEYPDSIREENERALGDILAHNDANPVSGGQGSLFHDRDPDGLPGDSQAQSTGEPFFSQLGFLPERERDELLGYLNDLFAKEDDVDMLLPEGVELTHALGDIETRLMSDDLYNKSYEETGVIVLDGISFTEEIKAIDVLLNPPARLHPWLKWMLYLKRVSPEMLELYQSALQKRDRIYFLAVKSKGRLKVRYQGKILDAPVFTWPDQAGGKYELVYIPPTKQLAQMSSAPKN